MTTESLVIPDGTPTVATVNPLPVTAPSVIPDTSLTETPYSPFPAVPLLNLSILAPSKTSNVVPPPTKDETTPSKVAGNTWDEFELVTCIASLPALPLEILCWNEPLNNSPFSFAPK